MTKIRGVAFAREPAGAWRGVAALRARHAANRPEGQPAGRSHTSGVVYCLSIVFVFPLLPVFVLSPFDCASFIPMRYRCTTLHSHCWTNTRHIDEHNAERVSRRSGMTDPSPRTNSLPLGKGNNLSRTVRA